MQPWKTLKVFVSSTFKDLELERDQLAKVFAEIQRSIFSRKLQLIPYDLRWREQSEKNLVNWCLDMVEECDYFIGILGYRYGWRPPYMANGKENTERLSITEMEIRKALEVIPANRRFFCFGDLQQYDNNQLASEAAEDLESIQKLKESLKSEKVFTYKNSQSVLQHLHKELQSIIDRDFSPGKQVKAGVTDRENALEEIISEKSKGFVGRLSYLKDIRNFCEESTEKNYLVVNAVAGTGKSALLANFICHWRKNMQIPLVAHYMSMSGDSRSVGGIVQSLTQQLIKLKILEEKSQTTIEEMVYHLRSGLANTKQHIVIAIDGLDEMEESSLTWLARDLPCNVRIVITTRAVGAWEELKNYPQIVQIELPTLQDKEILEIIDNYQRERNITLNSIEKNTLLKRATGNPLFLKVALDEMAAGGTAIAQLAETVDGLFHQILKRLQQSYGEKAIENYLGLIASGRGGIAEIELEKIMLDEHQRSISDDFMIRIHKSLDNFIVKREGLLNFFHPEFERTVKMFLGKAGMRWAHNRFSEYLLQQTYEYERVLFELPYQLQWAENYDTLLKTLSDLAFLEAKCSNNILLNSLLEDFERALHNQTVPLHENLDISCWGSGKINKEILRLIARAINLDLQFIRRYPQLLFQCLWNRCYWHDSPIAAKHHVKDAFKSGPLPWHRDDEKCIYHLAEYWRKLKESQRHFSWIRSKRPLPPGLNSPLLKVLYGHTRKVSDVTFNAQGSQVISAGEDREVYLWSVSTGEVIFRSAKHGKKVNCVSSSKSEDVFASGGSDNNIYLWSASQQKTLAVCAGHSLPITTIAFHPQHEQLASASYDGQIRLWNTQGELQATFSAKDGYAWKVLYSPDGKYLASAHKTGNICIWNTETQNLEFILKGHKGDVHALVFTPNGQQIISGGTDHSIRIWSITSRQCLRKIDAHRELISGLAIHPNGKYLYSVSWDRMLCTWELPFANCISKIKAHETEIRSLAINHLGTNLATTGVEGTVRIWSTQLGAVYRMRGHEGLISNLDFTENGEEISTGAADKRICIWSTKTGNCLRVQHGLYRTLQSPEGNSRLLVQQEGEELIVKARHIKHSLHFPAKVKQFKVAPHDNIISGYFGDYVYILELIAK